MQEGLLTFSANGRGYAIAVVGAMEDSFPDLTAGTKLEICLAGQWIPGSTEYASVYAERGAYPYGGGGYYFKARDDHSVVGLCIGTKVRIPE
jgi:hypothetical protein